MAVKNRVTYLGGPCYTPKLKVLSMMVIYSYFGSFECRQKSLGRVKNVFRNSKHYEK